MRIEEKLALNKFEVDKEPHISIDQEECRVCEIKPCLWACPASCFASKGDHVIFSYEGCLECGSCKAVCPRGAVHWGYPRGGFGVCYQYG